MPSICFYFQVHQPYRVKKYRIFEIGKDRDYFNDSSKSNLNNQKILAKVAEKCYLPANATFLKLLKTHPEFKISFSFSGVFLDQLENYSRRTLDSFRRLIETGKVEVLSETFYHSLSFLYSKKEFRRQVELHRRKIKKLFGVSPKVFRNTELIYNNELADYIGDLGFKGILTEGADKVLGWKSPNFLYKRGNTKVLLKNYKLSDDIAFRFSSKEWECFPLTAPTFASWVNKVNGNGHVVNLFMDYETFGEHQWADTGIFNFLNALPSEILKHPDNGFMTPSEVVKKFDPMDELDIPNYISWADVERDLSAWLSNDMQHEAINKLYQLEDKVLKTKDAKLIEDWRKLQTSDHFYYMCTKWFQDGDVHKYFNPYQSPYDAFISYMNVLKDMRLRIDEGKVKRNVSARPRAVTIN